MSCNMTQAIAAICRKVATFPVQFGCTRTLPTNKWSTALPTTMTISRLITRTGNQTGKRPYCGSTSLQLLMLRVMMPLSSSPLSAIGSRITPSALR